MQPYVFKKQIITITFIVLGCMINWINNEKLLASVFLFYCIHIVGLSVIPYLRKNYKYPMIIHYTLYHLPMLIPALFIRNQVIVKENMLTFVIGIVIGVLLILSNYKHNQVYVSENNPIINSALDTSTLIIELYHNIYVVVCEEVFFRLYIIGTLFHKLGIHAVLVSSILFLLSHFNNRWANKIYNVRSYTYHFITGLCFGLIYYNSGSILTCILAHLIFNSPEFLILLKRYKKFKESETIMFNDY